MRYRFRSNPPNTDIVLDNVGKGYKADKPEDAWVMFAHNVQEPSDTRTLAKIVEHMKTRYTIEEMGV